jgi:hypothetical protein
MTAPSKRKGNTYEYELVEEAMAAGLRAKRSWGSNGESLGYDKEVDLIVDGGHSLGMQKVQAKRRAKLPAYLQIPKGCDSVVFRQDYDQSLVLIPWTTYLAFLCKDKNGR